MLSVNVSITLCVAREREMVESEGESVCCL